MGKRSFKRFVHGLCIPESALKDVDARAHAKRSQPPSSSLPSLGAQGLYQNMVDRTPTPSEHEQPGTHTPPPSSRETLPSVLKKSSFRTAATITNRQKQRTSRPVSFYLYLAMALVGMTLIVDDQLGHQWIHQFMTDQFLAKHFAAVEDGQESAVSMMTNSSAVEVPETESASTDVTHAPSLLEGSRLVERLLSFQSHETAEEEEEQYEDEEEGHGGEQPRPAPKPYIEVSRFTELLSFSSPQEKDQEQEEVVPEPPTETPKSYIEVSRLTELLLPFKSDPEEMTGEAEDIPAPSTPNSFLEVSSFVGLVRSFRSHLSETKDEAVEPTVHDKEVDVADASWLVEHFHTMIDWTLPVSVVGAPLQDSVYSNLERFAATLTKRTPQWELALPAQAPWLVTFRETVVEPITNSEFVISAQTWLQEVMQGLQERVTAILTLARPAADRAVADLTGTATAITVFLAPALAWTGARGAELQQKILESVAWGQENQLSMDLERIKAVVSNQIIMLQDKLGNVADLIGARGAELQQKILESVAWAQENQLSMDLERTKAVVSSQIIMLQDKLGNVADLVGDNSTVAMGCCVGLVAMVLLLLVRSRLLRSRSVKTTDASQIESVHDGVKDEEEEETRGAEPSLPMKEKQAVGTNGDVTESDESTKGRQENKDQSMSSLDDEKEEETREVAPRPSEEKVLVVGANAGEVTGVEKNDEATVGEEDEEGTTHENEKDGVEGERKVAPTRRERRQMKKHDRRKELRKLASADTTKEGEDGITSDLSYEWIHKSYG